jgi:hypothetical protein
LTLPAPRGDPLASAISPSTLWTLGARRGGSNSSPHTRRHTPHSEKPIAGLVDDDDLSVILIDTKLEERVLGGLCDAPSRHLDPFHG